MPRMEDEASPFLRAEDLEASPAPPAAKKSASKAPRVLVAGALVLATLALAGSRYQDSRSTSSSLRTVGAAAPAEEKQMAAASSSEEDEDPLTLSKLSFGSPHAKKNKGGVVVADDKGDDDDGDDDDGDDGDDDADDETAPHYCDYDDFLVNPPTNCIPHAGDVGACEWCSINCLDDGDDDGSDMKGIKLKTCKYCKRHCETPDNTDAPTSAPSDPPTTYAPTTAAPTTAAPSGSHPPTEAPTSSPSYTPTMSPTVHPSLAPTAGPTVVPSLAPTSTPSYLPTVNPTFPPTPLPTTTPSYVPSSGPTPVPTPNPTIVPTPMPSPECPAMEYVYRLWLLDDGGDGWGNCEYSVYADNDDDYVLASGTLESGEYEVIWLCFTDGCYTAEVTDDCKHSSEISLQLDDEEGGKMTVGAGVTSDFCVYEGTWYDAPTASPSRPPTFYPTEEPTALPSPKPTRRPTKMPTSAPSEMPSSYPTEMPTPRPTRRPTKVPTSVPSEVPSPRPTFRPTKVPSPARTGAVGRCSHFDFYGAADFGTSERLELDGERQDLHTLTLRRDRERRTSRESENLQRDGLERDGLRETKTQRDADFERLTILPRKPRKPKLPPV